MDVICEYSHFGGSEILEHHYSKENKEIYDVIEDVVGAKTKISKEKNRKGKMLYSPTIFKSEFKENFEARDYQVLIDYYNYPQCNNNKKINAYKKFDFYKNRVAVQVQFGKYTFMTYDLTKFQYFFNENKIDVGVEIVPCLNLQKQMSSGTSYGEQLISEIKLLKRQFPIVPLKIILVDVEETETYQSKIII